MRSIIKGFLYLFLILLTGFCLTFTGCSSDSPSGNSIIQGPPLFDGYDRNEAAVNMTLAALCYTAENNPSVIAIRDSIILQLADTSYATKGRWKLAWGPGVSLTRGNLLYVAVDSTADTIYYAIAVRGTDWLFPTNLQEDMLVWNLMKYPFGSGIGDSVAEGTLYGLDTLLQTTDPVSGTTLQAFLNTFTGGHLKMFITGHSLGGALATLLSAWFIDQGYTNKFRLEAYTFASPSVGNLAFVERYHNIMLGAGAESHRVVNRKDLVPYGWANIPKIISDQIPTSLPFAIFSGLSLINFYLSSHGIVYKDVESRVDIGMLTPSNCTSGSQYENYFCWVAFEHATNNYLRLLQTDTVKFMK